MEKKLLQRLGDRALYKVEHFLPKYGLVTLVIEGRPPCKLLSTIKKAHQLSTTYLERSQRLFTEDKSVEYRAAAIFKRIDNESPERAAEIIAEHTQKLNSFRTNNYLLC